MSRLTRYSKRFSDSYRDDRDRSPKRGDTYVSSRDRSRLRDRDMEVVENVVPKTNSNTSILLTPFTFGMEWEPTWTGQYFPPDDNKHYDRETIFTSDNKKLIVTIEDFKIKDSLKNYSGITPKQVKDSCKYGIEMIMGILGKNPKVLVDSFIKDSEYFMSEIENELNDFEKKFFDNQQQNIRSLHTRNIYSPIDSNSFVNCGLTERLTEENKMIYPYYYMSNDNNIDILGGRPQVTIGVSYALFTPLLKFYNSGITKFALDLSTIIMSEPLLKDFFLEIETNNINNKLVYEGFCNLVIYYSTVAASYVHKNIASNYVGIQQLSYFKAAFHLKPRSNLAESYKHLNSEYEEFSTFIDLLNKTISGLLNNLFDPSQIDNYKSLVDYHLNIIRSIASDSNEIIQRLSDDKIYPLNNTDKYEDIIAFMKSINYHKYNNIIEVISVVNASYLIYKILHPQKVVKLKINRKKIKQNCKFLDGYYYSYEGESKDVIDDLVNKKYAEIINNKIYDFAHTSDPQILDVEKKEISNEIKSICPSDREELFEYIPEDSNLIIELRSPEHFTQNYRNIIDFGNSIKFNEITSFLKELFFTINSLFRIFLIQNSIISIQPSIQPSQTKSSMCNVMFKPKSTKGNRKTRK